MPLPIMTSKEDIDAIVAFLRTKPVGVNVDEAKATLEAKLLDGRKLNAYRTWGFITEDSGKLTLTKIGREYSKTSENEKWKYYLDVIRNERIYHLTAEWLYHRGFDQISATDVASHWFSHFREDIGTETEQSLTNQVTCFMNVASAAGLGEYKIGRRGQQTRLEINKSALKAFLEKAQEATDQGNEVDVADNDKATVDTSETVTQTPIPKRVLSREVTPGRSPSTPSLHINIQIHIGSDATTDQIDQIFASMAKHLKPLYDHQS